MTSGAQMGGGRSSYPDAGMPPVTTPSDAQHDLLSPPVAPPNGTSGPATRVAFDPRLPFAGLAPSFEPRRPRSRLLRRVGIAAIVTGVIGALVGGILLFGMIAAQQAHAALEREAAPYCAALQQEPDLLASPVFGWPEPAPTVQESIDQMRALEQRWQSLQPLAPDAMLEPTSLVARTVTALADSVESSRVLDHETNYNAMWRLAHVSEIRGWAGEYCG